MCRRYAILLVLTSVTGTLQGAETKAAAVHAEPHPVISVSSPYDAPASPSAGASRILDRAVVRGAITPGVLTRMGAHVSRRIPELGATEIAFPGSSFGAIARSLRVIGWTVEPVYAGSIASSIESCLAPGCGAPQWHHAATLATESWGESPSTRIQVAVLDTLIDTSHPDWIGTGGSGVDVVEGGQLMLSRARSYVTNHNGAAAYHGTFVAGLLAAARNGADAIGVAPEAVAIAPYAVVDGGGNTDSTALAAAIVQAWRDGARIINLSLGVLGDAPTLRDALRLVTAGDQLTPPALVVAAAGNNTGNAPFYPGSYPEALSVSGTAADDSPASCSNHNANVSVSAPADRLIGLAPMPQRLLQASCGTSAAAPQVSGLAALLLAQDPTRSPAALRSIIEATADDLGTPGRDDRFGHGRINVARALAGGAGARVARPTTIVGAVNQTVTTTVTATASNGTLHAARGVIGGRTISFTAADGNFDAASEFATGTLDLGGLAPGVHRLALSARDASGWGAPTSAIVVIDATPPVIGGIDAPTTVRATGSPVVRFSAVDAISNVVISGVQLRNTATGQVVNTATGWSPNGGQSVVVPVSDALLPGHYTVTVAVADPSGNVARAQTGTILV